VLAALTGLQIDNILIDINNPEPPIMDGSSQDFVRILKAAGIEAQKSPINPIIIDDTYTFSDPLNDVFIQISPSDKFEVFVEVDYNSSITPPQSAHLSYIEEFDTKIADSRTFCFLRDVLQLHQMGLVKGGSPQNAIVIVDGSEKEADLQQLAAIYKIPYATISKGFLQTKLRHENEMAKHKLLDIIGDLTLVGAPIIGKVTAIRPGHRANTELAKIILANTLVKAG
jgi:UDP-3-O-[3-hydroxymyristoyl] N-acetylglucosamine deacetylase/3-hydroxyacyl-[acyl-carrier-protein] dehydratase